MHTINSSVKTKGVVVEELIIDQYDSIDELLASETAEEIVSYFNAMKKTNVMNAARQKHQPSKAGKVKRMELGFQVAFDLFQDELAEAVAQGKASGNPNAAKDFVMSSKVQAEVDKLIGIAPSEEADE